MCSGEFFGGEQPAAGAAVAHDPLPLPDGRAKSGRVNRKDLARGGQQWLKALRFSAVGIEFGVGAALGYLSGHWLDEKLGTGRTLSLVMLLLGISAAFASLIRRAKELQREQGEGDDMDGQDE